jgi:hypothetical protein
VSEHGPPTRVLLRDGQLQIVRPCTEQAENLICQDGSQFTIGESPSAEVGLEAERVDFRGAHRIEASVLARRWPE